MHKDIHHLDSLLRQCSKNQIWVSSLFLVALVSSIEFIIGYELAVSILFLLPIALATWYGSRSQGIFFCIISATVCFVFDNVTSAHSYNNPLTPYWAPYWNMADQLTLFLIITLLIAKIKAQLHIEQQLSQMDKLTGVMNGRGFTEASQQILTLAARHGRPTILAYVGLDNFRQMNNAFGYSEGDRALQAVGQIFVNSMRKTDVVGRLGRDEFAILLPETNESGARTKLGKLKNELAQKAKAHNWPLGFNIGVVSFDMPPSSLQEAFKIADALMSQARKDSKNNIVFEHFPRDADPYFQAQGSFQTQSSLH